MDSNEKGSGLDALTAFAGIAATAVGLWALFQDDTSSPKSAKALKNQQAQKLFDEALWLQENGRLAEALTKARECLSINQHFAHAFKTKGVCGRARSINSSG